MTRLALSAALILTGALEPTRLHSEPSGVKRYGTAVSTRPVLTVMHRSRRPLLSRPNRSQDLRPVSAWTRLAACESGGRWHINTGNGYYGGTQMDLTFWRNYGGLAFAARPDLASRAQQVTVAERGLAVQGWGAWPTCSRGLR